jgi:hypothetical protein
MEQLILLLVVESIPKLLESSISSMSARKLLKDLLTVVSFKLNINEFEIILRIDFLKIT